MINELPNDIKILIHEEALRLKDMSISEIETFLATKYFEYRHRLDRDKEVSQSNEIALLELLKEYKEKIIKLQIK